MRQSDELNRKSENMVTVKRIPETVKNLTVATMDDHLKSNGMLPVEVTIVNVYETSIKDTRTGENVEKIAVVFGEIDERLLLNQVNFNTLVDAFADKKTGETDTDDWITKKVKLYLGTYMDSMTGKPAKGVRVKV